MPTNEFPEITVDDTIEIDLLIEHQCRVLTDMLHTVMHDSPRGRQITIQERRSELLELQQRVRNTRTSMLERGEGR